MKTWTIKEINFLREHAAGRSMRELAQLLGTTEDKIKGAMARYKINNGRDSRFHKDQVSWNKGKSMRLSPATEFKEGHLPHNTRNDGDISVRIDKTGRPYKYIRVAKANWQLLHRINYEKAFGEIPKGHLVTFRDGDSLNCEPANLILITKAQNARRNHNTEKARATMKTLWATERLRKKYGLWPKTKLGSRLKHAA